MNVPGGGGSGDDAVAQLHRLTFATRSGGLTHLLSALRSALGAEVGLFDIGGSTLATAPSRAMWDADAVRAAARSASKQQDLLVRTVEIKNDPVALLATRAAADPARLLDMAVDLVALELGRLRAGQQGRRELAEGVIDDVLAGRVTEADAVGRLRAVGVDTTRPQRALLGWAEMAAENRVRMTWGSVYALMDERPDPFLRVLRGERVLMIVPDDPMVDRIADTLCTQLGQTGSGARVGVSFAHSGAAGLRAAYFEALSAMHEGEGVQYPGRLDLSRLLVMTNTALPLAEVACDYLRPLSDHDAAHGSTLVATLRAYLHADRDVLATTSALFIHRNTLRYRIRQIVSLLDVDLEASHTIASLWLAFHSLEGEGTESSKGAW